MTKTTRSKVILQLTPVAQDHTIWVHFRSLTKYVNGSDQNNSFYDDDDDEDEDDDDDDYYYYYLVQHKGKSTCRQKTTLA